MILGVKERLRGGFMLLKVSGCFVWANVSRLIKTVLLIFLVHRIYFLLIIFRSVILSTESISYFFHS